MNKFLIVPLKAGFIGYLLFFAILSITKLVSSLVAQNALFVIEPEDALLCLIGFVLSFVAKILEPKSKN